MYPGSLSLLPATIAIARFMLTSGLAPIYPYWYLGTNLHYLIGPMGPGLLLALSAILPGISLFSLSLGMMVGGVVLGGVGVGVLAARLSGRNGFLVGSVAAILFWLNPWVWVSSLGLSEGGQGLGVVLLGWWVVAVLRVLRIQRRSTMIFLGGFLLAFVLLFSTSLFFDWFIIILSLELVAFGKTQSIVVAKNLLPLIRRRLYVYWIVVGLGLASFWYGWGYWWHVLLVPTVGGRTLFGAINHLWGFGGQLVPLLLVALGVDYWGKRLSQPQKWVATWTGLFLFLSLWRLVNDPDFWLDWSSWGVEIGLGLAVGGGLIIDKIYRWKRSSILFFCVLFVFFIWGWVFAWGQRNWWLPRMSLVGSVEGRITGWLGDAYDGSGRVFVSGASVFWLNALEPTIPQVRGGRDSGATYLGWREGMYVLRESMDPEEVMDWLDKLGVRLLVVQTPFSADFYHDYKNMTVYETLEKLGEVELLKDESGDRLYKVVH